MNDYILIGCGGFALEVVEYLKDKHLQVSALDRFSAITDVVSTTQSRFGDLCSILGYAPKFHGIPNTVQRRSEKKVLICLGSPEDRQKNFIELKRLDFIFGTLVHQSAWVAKSARIDEGAIICPFAFIGAMAWVGANSVINTRATVGHDVRVGMSSVLSPHCDMNGASKCGRVSFLGAGSILDPNIEIGEYTKVSSGTVVKQTFGDGFLLAGSPAKGRQMFKVGNLDAQ